MPNDNLCLEVVRLVLVAHQQASEDLAERGSLTRALHQCKRAIEEHAYEASSKEYLLSPRLRKAKELLVFTQQSIAEIAQHVGFPDPYYFSRLFHAKEGLTPTLFRVQQRIPPREDDENPS